MSFDDFAIVMLTAVVVTVIVTSIAVYIYFFRLWFQTYMAGAPIPVFTLIRMPFRQMVPGHMVRYYVQVAKA